LYRKMLNSSSIIEDQEGSHLPATNHLYYFSFCGCSGSDPFKRNPPPPPPHPRNWGKIQDCMHVRCSFSAISHFSFKGFPFSGTQLILERDFLKKKKFSSLNGLPYFFFFTGTWVTISNLNILTKVLGLYMNLY
jgi:hypothetical protein